MLRTGLEQLVKEALAGTQASARPSASWGDMHQGVAQAQAASVNPHPPQLPAPLPAARTIRDNMQLPANGGGVPPSGVPGGGGAGNGGGGIGKWLRPGARRTLGLAGIGAAGALAYGMHRQNAQDRENNSLVYAPLPGSVMQ